MNQFQVIVLATPVFLLLIGLEFAWGWTRQLRGTGHNTYRLNDALNSISLGVLSQLGGLFTKVLAVGIYTATYTSVAVWSAPEWWQTWYGVLLALVFYDFCYYWLHRAGHRVAVYWAAHVVHHQSQCYNLSTALRQTSSGALLGWVFYIPMAVVGVPPLIFGIVALIDLLYQFWVHTEQIGKLGWFDRVFCSPSNHRVHHAVNDKYLDKNYGGILVVWDRLFGTFREEVDPCIYGTRGPLNSWDPLWANLEVYWDLLQDSWHARRWTDKVRVWVMPPGWRPADVAARHPKPGFDIGQVSLYDPPIDNKTQWAAVMQFVVLLAGVSCVLWFAASWSTREIAVASAALLAAYWALGAALQGRIQVLEMLLIDSAALATATSALGLITLHFVFKPLTILIAIFFIATRANQSGASARFHHILMVALTFSLAGDVFLMLPGNYFIPGLACFLITHLLYLTVFSQGTRWFAHRAALFGTLAVGCAMYAWVWSGLPDPGLKIAVATYIVVIALMTAQAIGRAKEVRNPPSVWVALGTTVFMLSDALIAVNRFVQPVPLAAFWVLATYYLAQILIVHNATPVLTKPRSSHSNPYGNRSATASHASGAIRPS